MKSTLFYRHQYLIVVVLLGMLSLTPVKESRQIAELNQYDSLSGHTMGEQDSAFYFAFKAYTNYIKKTKDTLEYIAIADFTKPSSQKRFYIVHMPTESLLMTTYVTHGKHSGRDSTVQFSNELNSGQTSLGLYKIEGTYLGCHGKSIYLEGLDQHFNHAAKQRNIVMHTAAYADVSVISVLGRLGKSLGCPVLPEKDYLDVVQYLPNNALLFHYYPDAHYLANSVWLR